VIVVHDRTGPGAARSRRAGAPRTPRLYFGWKVTIVGSVILALHSAFVLQAFGSYAVVLREEFGWSTMTFSVAYAFNRAESGLLGPLHGWALQRFGAKRVMQVGAVFLLVGFLWFSQINTPLGFIVSYFVVAVGAGLAGFLTITTEIVHWFERRRSRALSMSNLGIAAGGLVAPLVVVMLRVLGWRLGAALTGIAVGAFVFAIAPMFGQRPEDRGEPIDGISPDAEPERDANGDVMPARPAQVQISARDALRTRAFWMLAFGHASALLVVGVVLAHLSLYLTSEQGYSLQKASFVMAAIAPLQVFGMVAGGFLGDKFDKRWLCSFAMLGHVFGLLMLTFATHIWMVGAFVVLHGIAWGMRGPLMVAIRADYFGPLSLGKIQGYTSIILMLAMVGGPLFAGILADTTGSYQLGFTILAILATTGTALFLLAKPPAAPVQGHPDPTLVSGAALTNP
jgi:MFS family permease